MDSLGLAAILYAAALALWCVTSMAANRRRAASFTVALGVLEVAVIGLAILDASNLIGGQHGSEVATNIGYLITLVAILPVTAAVVRLDPGRWGSAALAIGCLLVIVVAIRLQQTLHAGHA